MSEQAGTDLEHINARIRASKLELRDLKSLTKYSKNSRTHSADQILKLAASFKEWGFTNPLLIDGKGEIIAGHARAEAAETIGLTQVPCIVLDHLTEAQKKAYVIADNQLAISGSGWNRELLALELQELKKLNFKTELTGFEPKELRGLLDIGLNGKRENDAKLDDLLDAASKPDFVVRVKAGEIWALGDHRILCGDATDSAQISMLMAGRSVNLVVTDPPYNVAYEGKTKDKLVIANDSMGDGDFRTFLYKFYKAAFDVTAPGGAIYVYHADSEGYNFRGGLIDAGWLLKQCLIWVKNAMVMGRQDYQWKHEPILYGWKPGAAHQWNSDRKQTTILNFDRPSRSPDHPTPKPVEMLEYLIKNSSQQGDIVFDGFLGSGSTLIAAEQTSRVCYGTELSERYATVVLTRWENLTGKKGERIFPPADHAGENEAAAVDLSGEVAAAKGSDKVDLTSDQLNDEDLEALTRPTSAPESSAPADAGEPAQ